MKLTAKQAQELLKHAGLQDVELVEDEKESEYERDGALQAIDNARGEYIKPKIEETLKTEIESRIAGKVGGALERALIRKTGIDAAAFKGITKDDDKIDLAVQHLMSNQDKDKQDVQLELQKIADKHQQEKETIQKEWEGKYGELNEKYVSRDIKEYFRGFLKDKPVLGDRDVAAEDLYRFTKDDYIQKYNEEKKVVELYSRANPAMPAMNSAGTLPLDLAEYAKEKFKPRNMWADDTRHIKPTDAMRQEQQQRQRQLPTQPEQATLGAPKNPRLAELQEQLKERTQQA